MLGDGTGITFGLAAAIVAGVAALWWRIEGKFDEERSARESVALSDQNGRMLIQRELADFRLYAAQNYVSALSLRETEERLIASNDRLSESLDKIVNRLDRLSNDMARAGIANAGK